MAAELVLDAGRKLGTQHVVVAYYFCSRREGGDASEFVLQISEQLRKALQPYRWAVVASGPFCGGISYTLEHES